MTEPLVLIHFIISGVDRTDGLKSVFSYGGGVSTLQIFQNQIVVVTERITANVHAYQYSAFRDTVHLLLSP